MRQTYVAPFAAIALMALALAGCSNRSSADASQSAAADALRSAVAATQQGDASGRVIFNQSTETVGRSERSCYEGRTQTDSSGTMLAIELSIRTGDGNLDSQCASATPVAHYIVSGTDAYYETPAGSGSWTKATLTGEAAKELGAVASAAQLRQQLALLDSATSIVEGEAADTVVVTYDGAGAIKKIYEISGQGSVAATIESGTLQYTYQIDPASGRVISSVALGHLTKDGLPVTAVMWTTLEWGPQTIAVPEAPADSGITYSSAAEFTHAATAT